MNIGEAAKNSGVSAKMIRYYESIGLVAVAVRSDKGYRHYTEIDIHRLRFVRRARDLGFPIEKITALLGLWGNSRRSSAKVKEMTLVHIGELKHQIANMRAMLLTLEHLAASCHGNEMPECPIIADLSNDRSARQPLKPPQKRRRL